METPFCWSALPQLSDAYSPHGSPIGGGEDAVFLHRRRGGRERLPARLAQAVMWSFRPKLAIAPQAAALRQLLPRA
jgi:hypothetical protein